jgi:hypothetical protein
MAPAIPQPTADARSKNNTPSAKRALTFIEYRLRNTENKRRMTRDDLRKNGTTTTTASHPTDPVPDSDRPAAWQEHPPPPPLPWAGLTAPLDGAPPAVAGGAVPASSTGTHAAPRQR